MKKKLLIVDDDIAITNYLHVFFLQRDEFTPTILNDSTEVINILRREYFDLLLIDIDMPVLSGLEVLKQLKDQDIIIPTIVLTGVMEVELAVTAMKHGAFDLLTKPIEADTLLEVIEKALSQSLIEHTLQTTTQDNLPVYSVHAPGLFTIVSQDDEMLKLIHNAYQFTTSDDPILLSGERGVGKKTMAKAIHDASSRKTEPFHHINLAKIYSLEQEKQVTQLISDIPNGTLLLINIDHAYRPFQQQLCSILKSKHYKDPHGQVRPLSCRLMASTDMPCQHLQYSRFFDPELWLEWMKHPLNLISLRHRPKDIVLYTNHFLHFYAKQYQSPIKQLHPTTMECLKQYRFPYNLEELNHIVYYMNYRFSERILLPHHLPSYLSNGTQV